MFRIALHFVLLLPALAFILSTTSHAEDHRGELSFPNWENAEGTIKIPIIKVKYTLSVFFGEPTETFFFYYEPIDDFTRINSIKMTAQVVAGGNITDAYINIDPLVDQPKKWGWDVPGSPDWGKMFHTKQGGFIDKERAKQFFKDGIALTNLGIVDMYASSGVDDAEYDAFGAQIPTSYVSNNSEVGQLDRSLPPTNFGGSDFGDGTVQSSWSNTNMWKKRLTGADFTNQLANVTKENVKSLSLKGTTHTTWKYNLYQHAAIELLLSEFAFKDKSTQEIYIDIIWEDWSGGNRRQVQKHTFHKTLKPNQRMTAIDRVRRKQLDDGSLATYHVSYHIRFLDTDEEEEAEDPLEELEEKRTYEAKLYQIKTLAKQAKADREQYERELLARREQAKKDRDAERARKREEQKLLLPDPVRTPPQDVEETPAMPEQPIQEAKATVTAPLPSLENVLKITSPAAGSSAQYFYTTLEGRVDTSIFNAARGDSVQVTCIGMTQEIRVNDSGSFSIPVILGAGANDVQLTLKIGERSTEKTLRITYTGKRSKYRVVVTTPNPYIQDFEVQIFRSDNYEAMYGDLYEQHMDDWGSNSMMRSGAVIKPWGGEHRFLVQFNYGDLLGRTINIHTFKDDRFLSTRKKTFENTAVDGTSLNRWVTREIDKVFLD